MMSIGSEREGGKEGRSSRRKVIRARDLEERCWDVVVRGLLLDLIHFFHLIAILRELIFVFLTILSRTLNDLPHMSRYGFEGEGVKQCPDRGRLSVGRFS
jgi:hypothetical protein